MHPAAPQRDPCGQEQLSVANSQQAPGAANSQVSQLGSGSSASPTLKWLHPPMTPRFSLWETANQRTQLGCLQILDPQELGGHKRCLKPTRLGYFIIHHQIANYSESEVLILSLSRTLLAGPRVTSVPPLPLLSLWKVWLVRHDTLSPHSRQPPATNWMGNSDKAMCPPAPVLWEKRYHLGQLMRPRISFPRPWFLYSPLCLSLGVQLHWGS